MAAVGNDIWSESDQFHFVCAPHAGDGTFTVRVDSQQDTHPWAKAGIMLRGSRSPDAAYVMMSITPGEGAQLQYRPDSGRPSSSSRFGDPDRTVKAPYWLRLTRSGNLYVGAISADGSVWQEVGSIDLPNLPVLLYGGLAATAVSKNSSGAVKFSNLKIDGLK